MGVSVVLASFIVLIGFMAIFSTVSTAFFTGMKDLSFTANDYMTQQKDKINTQIQLTVDSISGTVCEVTIKNTGSKTIFMQNSDGFNWNTIILSYGNSSQWHSYAIEGYEILDAKVSGTNTTFSIATHNFINPGEQMSISLSLPSGAPEISVQDVVSITFASYYGVTASGEAVRGQ